MNEFHTRVAARRRPRHAPVDPPPPMPDQPHPCPPELRDPDAATRAADLAVPCPHCHAPAGTRCTVPGTNRPPDGGTHTARHTAANQHGEATR